MKKECKIDKVEWEIAEVEICGRKKSKYKNFKMK